MFIQACFKNSFVRMDYIADSVYLELFTKCPCKKINGSKCTKEINLDNLIMKYKLNEYKTLSIETKRYKIRELYDVEIYLKCPKPDCPNGDGFPNKDVVKYILKAQGSTEISPLYKCNLCTTIWCSKCDKSHPGKICSEVDDDKLDEYTKRCPKCKIPITRSEGCFHMNCTRCDAHWCWNCNQLITGEIADHRCISGNWIEAS
jgi:hypothetical protein